MKLALGLAFFLSVSAWAADDEPLLLSGTEIPGLFSSDTPGPYDDIFELLVEGHTDVSLMRGPMRRAQRAFLAQRSECLFVGSGNADLYVTLGMPKDKILVSNGVNPVTVRIYSRPDEPVISDVDQLKGEAIAVDIAAGSSQNFYDRHFPKEIRILSAEKLEQAFALLHQKRVIAVVAFDLDVALLMKRSPDLADFDYDRSMALDRSQDAIVCWRTPKTEAFIMHVNNRLIELQAAGTIRSILKEQDLILSR